MNGTALQGGEEIKLAHRWTLEELWSFTLKLDRLEQMLESKTKTEAKSTTVTVAEAITEQEAKAAPETEAKNMPEAIGAAPLEILPAWETPLEAADGAIMPEEAAAEGAAPEAAAAEQVAVKAIAELIGMEPPGEIFPDAEKNVSEKKPRRKKLSGFDVFLIVAGALTLLALLVLIAQAVGWPIDTLLN